MVLLLTPRVTAAPTAVIVVVRSSTGLSGVPINPCVHPSVSLAQNHGSSSEFPPASVVANSGAVWTSLFQSVQQSDCMTILFREAS